MRSVSQDAFVVAKQVARATSRIAAAAAFATVAAAPAAAAPQRQTVHAELTTTRPGAPTGVRLSVDWRNPANPVGKPYAVSRMVSRLAPGHVIDTGALEQCRASNAELYARGAAACPAGSRLGGGSIVSDSGGAFGPIPRFNENRVDQFNTAGGMVVVAETKNAPIIPGITRVVSRPTIRGNVITSNFPTLPGRPPPDPYTALRTLRLASPPLVRGGRAYWRTPPTCSSSGRWTGSMTFTYKDGVSQTVPTVAPCSRPAVAPARLTLRLSGRRGRRGCFRSRVRATVTGRDRGLARRADFLIGGKRFARDTRPPLSRILDRPRHRGRSHVHVARARVRLSDRRLVRLKKRYRICDERRRH